MHNTEYKHKRGVEANYCDKQLIIVLKLIANKVSKSLENSKHSYSAINNHIISASVDKTKANQILIKV